MSQNLFWLLVAAAKDDVVLINAESEMWGNMEFIDKVKLSVEKSVILQTRNKEKHITSSNMEPKTFPKS